MTTSQIKYVRGLLHKAGLTDQKDDIVYGYTNGRTTHLTDMTQSETNVLITALTGRSKRDSMTGKILSMAHEMGWELPDGKVDIKRINAWCTKYTAGKKELNKIKDDELPLVVTVFERVYLSFLNGI